jgi:hypothetical protein
MKEFRPIKRATIREWTMLFISTTLPAATRRRVSPQAAAVFPIGPVSQPASSHGHFVSTSTTQSVG